MELRRSWWKLPLKAVSVVVLAHAAGLGQPMPDPVLRLENLTLQKAVDLALQQNPMMGEIAATGRGARARLDEAEAARLPFLRLGETYTHSNNPVYVFGSLLEQGRFGQDNFSTDFLNHPPSYSNFRSALNLRIPVFNRREILSKVEQARLGVESSETAREMVEQKIRYLVVQAYYGILVAEARKTAADQAVETALAERKRIGDLVEEGMVVMSDLLATEVQLADFQKEAIQAEGELRNAYAVLNTVLGRPAEAEVTILGELRDLQLSAAESGQLIAEAMTSRPDLEQARQEVAILAQDVRFAKGRILPDLNLFAQYGYSAQNLVTGSGDFAVGATLNLDILDFGRSARVRGADSEWEAARMRQRQKEHAVTLEVVQSRNAFLTARERLQVASKAVLQAEENLRIVRDRHNEGLSTISEVLQAQTALLRARMNQLGARYDYYLGYAGVLLASGRLTDLTAYIP